MYKNFLLVIMSLFLFSFFLNRAVLAAESSGITKAGVSFDYSSGMPLQTDLELVTLLNTDWLVLQLETRFEVPVDEELGSMKVEFNFPAFSENWDSYLYYFPETKQAEWLAGSSYYYQLGEPLEVKLRADFGGRNSTSGSLYLYQSQGQQLRLDYAQQLWSYRLDLAHTAKEYPLANYYTSTKLNLTQRLIYRYRDNTKFGLLYAEDTGAYPDPRSLERNYYQSNYQVFGAGRYTDIYWWNGEYSFVRRVQGYGLHHLQQTGEFWLTAAWWENAQLSARVRLADFDYYTKVIDSFIDEGEVEEDPQSRLDKTLSLTYHWETKQLKVEVGLFWSLKDYKVQELSDKIRFGYYTAWRFDYHWGDFYLKAAPQGRLNSENSLYQLGIEYRR